MLDPKRGEKGTGAVEGESHVQGSEDSVPCGLGHQTQAEYGCVHTGAPCVSKAGPREP